MGVQGLWALLEPSGKPVPLETLQGRRLAVDLSVWLHQAMHVGGSPVAVLLTRICKLLFHGIKPVFVFDGPAPEIKRSCLNRRRQRRAEAIANATTLRTAVLSNYLKSQAIDAAAAAASAVSGPPKKPRLLPQAIVRSRDDMYTLPDPIGPQDSVLASADEADERVDIESFSALHAESMADKLESIDTESDDFKNLPLEVQHEILYDIREVKKRRCLNSSSDILPTDLHDFSQFQLHSFLKRSELTKKIEGLRKEMMRDGLGLLGLENVDGAVTRKVANEDNSYLLYVNSVPKRRQPESDPNRTIDDSGESCRHRSAVSNGGGGGGRYEEVGGRRKCDTNASDDGAVMLNLGTSAASRASLSDDSSSDGEFEDVPEFQGPAFVPPGLEKPPDASEILEVLHNNQGNSSEMSSTGVLIRRIGTGLAETPEKAVSCLDSCDPVEEIVNLSGDEFAMHIEEMSDSLCAVTSERQHEISPETVGVSPMPVNAARNEESSQTVANIVESAPTLDEDREESICSIDNRGVPEEQYLPERTMNMTQSWDEESSNQVKEPPGCVSPECVPALLDKETIQRELEAETERLTRELEKQEATSLCDMHYELCQELLQCFGLPYVVSPGEAEAQCAWLDMQGLVDGVITDDSDAWLFGAKTVYRNFFEKDKFVQQYTQSDIESVIHVNRQRLICLALLLGSDYSDGVENIGVVHGMEIIQEFSNKSSESPSPLQPLEAYKTWLGAKRREVMPEFENSVRRRLFKFKLPEGFPSSAVLEAYQKPLVDETKTPFKFGKVDIELLRRFTAKHLAWTPWKLDQKINPVLEKMQSYSSAQMKMDQFYSVNFSNCQKNLKSKRVNRAIKKMSRLDAPPVQSTCEAASPSKAVEIVVKGHFDAVEHLSLRERNSEHLGSASQDTSQVEKTPQKSGVNRFGLRRFSGGRAAAATTATIQRQQFAFETHPHHETR